MTNNFPPNLLSGYSRFRTGRFEFERDRYRELAADGQKPQVLVIACCDSRAAPETIFNAAPGELFVVRNVANLVPPYAPDNQMHATSAALEYGVRTLQVRNIVVLGHGRCGGVTAILQKDAGQSESTDFVGNWVDALATLADEVIGEGSIAPADRQTEMERRSISQSLCNLRTFPWIARQEQESRLSMHGAWFDISTGELWLREAENDEFYLAEPNLPPNSRPG